MRHKLHSLFLCMFRAVPGIPKHLQRQLTLTNVYANFRILEETRNWTINMEVEFSEVGMMSTRKFLNKNISKTRQSCNSVI